MTRRGFSDTPLTRGAPQPRQPNLSIQAKFQTGLAFHQQGRVAEAAKFYEEILSIDNNHFDALHFLGVAHHQSGQYARAVELISRAIEINASVAAAHFDRGVALQKLQRFDEAIASYNKAIGLKPDYAEAYSNRGTALKGLKHFNEAVASYDKAIELKPDRAEFHSNRGNALKDLRRFDEAMASYNIVIGLKPDYAEAYRNKAFVELLLGDFASGLWNHEWRKAKTEPAGNRTYLQPSLTSLAQAIGKTILVYWEQGLGDTLQFCRYASLLAERGAKVLFAPQSELRNLLKALDGEVELVDVDDKNLVFDYHIPLMSLPLLFETTLETIPAEAPYLYADPDFIEKWRGRLGKQSLKIGVCCKGSSSYEGDAHRSFSINFFEPISKLPDVRLISLHKGESEEQLKSLPDGMVVETLGSDFDSGSGAFVDTAAVMMNLDLVITSDTVIAHLAGALGVATWVVLQYDPEWRWMLDRDDSLWYPTVRLFRQKTDGDWNGVFKEIETFLIRLREKPRIGLTDRHQPLR